MIPPYRKYSDGRIEADGYLFDSDNEFGEYCEYQDMCREYWEKQKQLEKENRLLDLEEKYDIQL